MLGLALSRNAFVLYAIIGIVAWGSIAVKKHDTKVARAAVAEHTEKAREVVKKARTAQRRVDPDSARGVLDSKYCAGC
jgi:hypothetical protein